MTFLEELEKKVLQIIQSHQELMTQVQLLEKKILEEQEKSNLLEISLLKESEKNQLLTSEKDAMRASIEHLLISINRLEDLR